MNSDSLLTAQQLAEHLCVTPNTIRRWTRVGLIPAVHLPGSGIRFDYRRVRARLDLLDKSATPAQEQSTEGEVRHAR
jgi:excisionase family DNA binding protein